MPLWRANMRELGCRERVGEGGWWKADGGEGWAGRGVDEAAFNGMIQMELFYERAVAQYGSQGLGRIVIQKKRATAYGSQ